MSAPDQSQAATTNPSVDEVIESLKQHEATLAQLLDRNLRAAQA